MSYYYDGDYDPETMKGYCITCRGECVALIINVEEASDDCPESCEIVCQECGDHCIDWYEYESSKDYYDGVEED